MNCSKNEEANDKVVNSFLLQFKIFKNIIQCLYFDFLQVVKDERRLAKYVEISQVLVSKNENILLKEEVVKINLKKQGLLILNSMDLFKINFSVKVFMDCNAKMGLSIDNFDF